MELRRICLAVGGIVGYASRSNLVSCKNTGDIKNKSCAGGIIGFAYQGNSVDSCYNSGTLNVVQSNGTSVYGVCHGGIIGYSSSIKIKNCTNIGDISNGTYVAGIVGLLNKDTYSSDLNIQNCKNEGDILCTSYDNTVWTAHGVESGAKGGYGGGIIGLGGSCIIESCSNKGNVYGTYTDNIFGFGGIAGDIRIGEIKKCFNSGTIGNTTISKTYHEAIGGILGAGLNNVDIYNCYNTGIVSGYRQIGGILGSGNSVDIRYCYNTGKISSNGDYSGGIIGVLDAFNANSNENNYIYYCYNIGNISASSGISANICGYYNYLNKANHVYGLLSANSTLWGTTGVGGSITNTQIYSDKTSMISESSLISTGYFVEDKSNINNGYPILSWQ